MPIVTNSAPTNSLNPTLTTNDITPLVFTSSQFSAGYFDINGDAFSGIKITQLESSGSLEFWNGSAWTAVTLNQVITKASLDAGSLRFIPDEMGIDATFKFAVRDAKGAFDATPNTVTIDVVSTNNAPVFTSGTTLTTNEDNAVTYYAYATDADSDALTYSLQSNASHGQVVFANGEDFTYTPDANYNGADSFVIAVSDGIATVTRTVNVTVNSVNDAPVVSAPVTLVSTVEDSGAITITNAQLIAHATDVDVGTVLTATNVSTNAGTLVDNEDGTWTLTPAANYNGTITLSYDVSDGTTTTAATATQVVTAVNDAAVIGGTLTGSVTEETALTATGTATSADVDNTANLFQSVAAGAASANGYGTYEVTTAGDWTYTLNNALEAVQTLNEGDTLTDTITLTSEDGTTQTVTITINGTNEFNHQPVLVDDTQALTAIDEDSNGLPGTTVADLIAANSITDIDGAVDAIAITGIASSGPLQVTMNGAAENSVDAATDASGNIYIAYERDGVVYTNTYNATSQSWGSEVTVGTGTDANIAVDGNGVAHIAYINAGNVQYANSTDWMSISTPGMQNGTATMIDIAVEADGTVHMAVREDCGDQYYGEPAYITNSSGDFVETALDNSGGGGGSYHYSGNPTIAVDSNGDYHIVANWFNADSFAGAPDPAGFVYWTNANGGASYGNTIIGFQDWGNNGSVGGMFEDLRGSLQIDPVTDTPYLVYHDPFNYSYGGVPAGGYSGAVNTLISVDLSAGWNETIISGITGTHQTLSIDADGKQTVVYIDGTGQMMTMSSTDNGATWSEPSAVETAGTTPSSPVITSNGDVIYLASDGDTEVYHTSVSQMPSPGTWEYSTDAGDTWNTINPATLSDTNALLLSSTDLIRFVPSANYNGDQSFTFKAWDQFTGTAGTYADTTIDPVGDDQPAFSSASGTATITVTAVNDAPENIALSANSVAEGAANGTVIGTLSATDIEGDEVTFSVIDPVGVFSVNGSNQLVVADGESLDYETQDSITITVQAIDANGASSTQEVTILLTNVNDNAPVLADVTTSIDENSAEATIVVDLDANDADGELNPLTYTVTGGTGSALFDVSADGIVTVAEGAVLDYEDETSYTLNVEVTDGTHTDTATVTINLNNTNDNAPTFTSVDTASVAENTTAVTTVEATDLDGSLNAFTYSISGGADSALFTINETTGALSFIAAPNFEAPSDAGEDNVYNVTVAVSDTLHSVTQDITVTVTDANDAPVIANDLLDPALEFSTTTFTLDDLEASDEDGNPLTFTLTSLPELGQLYLNEQLMEVGDTFTNDDINSGALKYANDGRGTTDLQGHDSFGITVGDGEDTTAGTVDINVYRDNTAPILDLNGLVLGGINGNPVEYTEEAAAVVLAPVVSFTDTDTPDLTDGHLLVEITANSETADVLSVHNGGSNGRITISGDAVSFDGTIIGHVDSTNNGIDGAPLQINFDANPVSVIAVRHLVQSVTFESDSVGTHSDVVKTINFTVNDGEGVVAETSADATVTLTAHPHNDAPVAYEYNLSNMYENASTGNMVTTILNGATDEEGDEITVTAVDTAGTIGIVTFDEMAQTLYYESENMDQLGEDEIGTDSFTYTISDGVNEDTATINWTITGVNDAPVAVDDVNTISADATEAINGNMITDVSIAPFSAPVIAVNTSISTTLAQDEANEDRADVYGVHFVQGTTYTIDLSSNLDAFLSLYDASGTQLARNDDWAGLNSHIVYSATTTGTYYLVAKDLGDRVNMNYTLQVSDGGAVTPAVKAEEESGFIVPTASQIWNDASLQHATAIDSDIDHGAVLSVADVSTSAGTPPGSINDYVSETVDTRWDINPQVINLGDEVTGSVDFNAGDDSDGFHIHLTPGDYQLTIASVQNVSIDVYQVGPSYTFINGYQNAQQSNLHITVEADYLLIPYVYSGNPTYTFSVVTAGNQETINLGQAFAGTYGTFLVNADGSYTYTVDTENSDLIALGEGESVEDTITYTLTDEHGATDTATLTVTVNGVNDAPVIVASGEGFSESNVPFAFDGLGGNPGPITVSDAEDDILTVTLSATAGTGTLDIDEVLAGETLDSFSGDVSSEVTLVGTSDAINAVLADLTFISNNGWYGTGSVTVEATDGLDAAVSQAINYEIVPTSEEYYFDANFDELVLEDGNGGVLLGQNVIYNFTLGDGVEESDYDSLTISGASAADADIVIGDLDGNPGNGDNLLINFADASVALVGVANDVNFDSGRITFQDGSFLKLNTSGEKALIIGGAAADQLIAGNMGDTLRGLGGDDKLIGGEGNDWIYGGSGNDLIEAGAGNNMINGGVGDDDMVAGEGQDWFSYSGKLGGLNSGFDAIFNFDVAMDKIQLTGFKTISPSLMDTIVFGDTVGDGSGDATLMLADNSIITLVGVNVNDLSINNFAGYSDTFTAI